MPVLCVKTSKLIPAKISVILAMAHKYNCLPVFSWAKAPALYLTMSQVVEEVVEEEDHFLDLAFRAQIELRNVKVKAKLR